MAELPMFPLGSVLFPGAILPLHVFESRYRALVQHCLTDGNEPEFGVVLIDRGSEVGGGDVRRPIGTVARLVQVTELDGGRYAIVAVGTRRIAVNTWLPDDPYPRADVDELIDPPPSPDFPAKVAANVALLRRVLALRAELDEPAAPATTELADQPELASYHACALAPFGPADLDALLAAPTPDDRMDRLHVLLSDESEILTLRLGGG